MRRIELSKRTRLPFVVKTRCPECADEVATDILENYLSYPVLGERSEINMWCESCSLDFEVEVVVDVTLEAVDSKVTVERITK